MFEFLYDISGSERCLVSDLPIEKTTRVEKGQFVRTTHNPSTGKIVAEPIGAYIGVATETHTGVYDASNPRSNGEVISVIISPMAVYATDYPEIEFVVASTDSTTATFPGPSSYSESDLRGGHMILASKGASSTNTDALGAVRHITGYDKTSLTMTLSAGGKISVGDKYAIMLPLCSKRQMLNQTCDGLVLGPNTSGDFLLVGNDMANRKIHVTCRNRQIS